MGRQLELFRYLHRQLATYRANGVFLPDGSEVVGISFQCLSGRESNEVEEISGVVKL